MGTRLFRWMLFGLLAIMPAVSAAQPRLESRVSVGVGAGVAFPLHGDFNFTPWAWDADIRVAMSPRVMFEAAVGEWRHAETTVLVNVPVLNATGPNGTFGRLEQTHRHRQRSWQANMLATGVHGRLRVFGGGGVGLLEYHRRFRQTIDDCSASLVELCGSSENTFSNVTATVQGVGGADVNVVGAMSIYSQLRFVVPMTDPGAGDVRVTAGARWGW